MRLSIGLPVGLAALALVSAAGAEQRYTDATGDSGAAPDLGQVGVTNDAGSVQFDIAIPARLPEPDEAYLLMLDSDLDSATGDQGAEVQVFSMGLSSYVEAWNGSAWVDAPSGGISVRIEVGADTGRWLVKLPRTLLANRQTFRFILLSAKFSGDEIVAADHAPDDASWQYAIVSAQCSNRRDDDADGKVDVADLGCQDGEDDLESDDPFTLAVGRPQAKPAVARAGMQVTVNAPVRQAETGRPIATGTVRCTAKIGPTTKRWAGLLVSGEATCTLKAPKVARPTMVKGALTVSSTSKTASASFAFRVR